MFDPSRMAAIVTVLVLAGPASTRASETGLDLPESVRQDPNTGQVFCSNVAGKGPTYEDGDGFISLLTVKGTVEQLRFLPVKGDPPLNAPKGLAVDADNHLLFVADIDRVVGYDTRNRRQVCEISLRQSDARFANAILILPRPRDPALRAQEKAQHRLLVSDTRTGVLHLIELDSQLKQVAIGIISSDAVQPKKALADPNGLALDGGGNLLLACCPMGRGDHASVWRLSPSDNGKITAASRFTAEALALPAGSWDGLIAVDNAIYASDWDSQAVWELRGGQARKLREGLKGPADIGLVRDGGRNVILVPEMQADRVTRIEL